MILFPGRHLMGVLEYHQLTPPNNMVELKNPWAVCELRAEKKSSSRLSGGCAIAIMTGKKRSIHLSGGCTIVITSGKKKVLVICLAGVRSVLRAEKKKFWSSVWRVRDWYYDRKKKVQVVCLAGAQLLLRAEKKSSSHLSGGCAIAIMTGKKKFKLSVWWVREPYYEQKKKFKSSVWWVRNCNYDQKKRV